MDKSFNCMIDTEEKYSIICFDREGDILKAKIFNEEIDINIMKNEFNKIKSAVNVFIERFNKFGLNNIIWL